MEEFQRKVEAFFSQLGVSGKKIQAFLESDQKDYRAFLLSKDKGVRKLGYQKDLRKVVRHRGLILPGVKLIIASITPEGNEVALAQASDTQVIFPSNEIKEWLYFHKATVESPTLAAYYTFYEIIGFKSDLDPELIYIGEETTTRVQENRDIIYDISFFYKVKVPYEVIQKVESKGKWKIFLLSDIEPIL